MRAAGVCAGDLYIYLGKNPYVTYPRVGGHEIAGAVAALGPETAGPASARRSSSSRSSAAGTAIPAASANRTAAPICRSSACIATAALPTTSVAPVDRLHAVPAGLTPFQASFAEPVAIGVQACRRGMVGADDTVLVLGAGPIGLALIEVARARGARVCITDIAAERLATAAELGATPLAGGAGLLDEVMRLTNGEGMPVVIEATGNAKAMESTVDLVAAGGRIVIVGLVKKGASVSLPGPRFHPQGDDHRRLAGERRLLSPRAST